MITNRLDPGAELTPDEQPEELQADAAEQRAAQDKHKADQAAMQALAMQNDLAVKAGKMVIAKGADGVPRLFPSSLVAGNPAAAPMAASTLDFANDPSSLAPPKASELAPADELAAAKQKREHDEGLDRGLRSGTLVPVVDNATGETRIMPAVNGVAIAGAAPLEVRGGTPAAPVAAAAPVGGAVPGAAAGAAPAAAPAPAMGGGISLGQPTLGFGQQGNPAIGQIDALGRRQEKSAADSEAELGRIAKTAKEATAQWATAETKENADQAKILQDGYNASQAQQAQVLIDQAAHKQAVDAQDKRIATALDAVTTGKVNPYHLLSDTGSKVSFGLSVALSGIGAAIQGGGAQNLALGIWKDAIDKDIDAQKANMQHADRNLTNELSVYQKLRQQGMDDDEATKTARLMLWQKVAHEVDLVKANFNTDTAPLLGTMKALGIDAELAKTKNELRQKAFADSLAATSQAGQFREGELNRDNALGIHIATTGQTNSQKQVANFVPGVGFAGDDVSKREVQAAHEAHLNAMDAYSGIAALREKYDGGVNETFNAQDAQTLQKYADDIRRSIQVMFEMHSINEGERKSLLDQVPNPTAYSPLGTVDAAFAALKNKEIRHWNHTVETKILQRVPGYAPEATDEEKSEAKLAADAGATLR